LSAGGGPRFPVRVDEKLLAEDLSRTARTATAAIQSVMVEVRRDGVPYGAGRLTALDCEDTKVLNMASATKTRQTSGKKLPQIGEVAEQVGLSPRTVRDGGGVGMFSAPTRRSGGSRLYSEGGD
jgi:uncharacterized protein YciW